MYKHTSINPYSHNIFFFNIQYWQHIRNIWWCCLHTNEYTFIQISKYQTIFTYISFFFSKFNIDNTFEIIYFFVFQPSCYIIGNKVVICAWENYWRIHILIHIYVINYVIIIELSPLSEFCDIVNKIKIYCIGQV